MEPHLPYLASAYFPQPVPHSALSPCLLSSSSLYTACHSNMGSLDTELSRCLTCHCTEYDWRACNADDYTCSKCKDLISFGSQRDAFLKLYHHLTSTLPQPLSLPYLFEYLYPVSLRYKYTCIQRQQTLRFFLLGAAYTVNYIYNLHTRLQEQIRRGYTRRGNTYYQQIWNDETDFLTIVCDFLI